MGEIVLIRARPERAFFQPSVFQVPVFGIAVLGRVPLVIDDILTFWTGWLDLLP